MNDYIKQRHHSVLAAFSGLFWIIKSQPNYIIHLIISILAVLLGVYFSISSTEWIVVALVITLGLVIETVNTAIEVTTDAVAQGQIRQDIKIAKDVSAAAMLVYAIGASIIAIMIFSPHFFAVKF